MGVVEEYLKRRSIIQQRLHEFSCVRHEGEERLFYELCFCLLTPQSNGKQCWDAVGLLMRHDFFHRRLSACTLERCLRQKTRFHVTKTRYLLKMKREFPAIARALSEHTDGASLRLWLVEHVKGMGLKEASHFLRNIGFRNLAILDRHVLKHLVRERVLPRLPHTLTSRTYLFIEKRFHAYSKRVEVPLDCLDLVFWSMETGEVFK